MDSELRALKNDLEQSVYNYREGQGPLRKVEELTIEQATDLIKWAHPLSWQIQTSVYMKPGVVWRFGGLLMMTPWNDLIADHTMSKYVAEQRRIGLKSIRDRVNVCRAQLGLPLE